MKKLTLILTLLFSTVMFSSPSYAEWENKNYYIWFVVALHINKNFTSVVSDYKTFYTEKDCKNELMKGLTNPKSAIASELSINGEYTVKQHRVGNGITLLQKNNTRHHEVTCMSKNLTSAMNFDDWKKEVKKNYKP